MCFRINALNSSKIFLLKKDKAGVEFAKFYNCNCFTQSGNYLRYYGYKLIF